MFVAELRTVNFTFRSLGTTEHHARTLLRLAWNEHRREYGAARVDAWRGFADDVQVFELGIGAAMRDDEVIYPRSKA